MFPVNNKLLTEEVEELAVPLEHSLLSMLIRVSSCFLQLSSPTILMLPVSNNNTISESDGIGFLRLLWLLIL